MKKYYKQLWIAAIVDAAGQLKTLLDKTSGYVDARAIVRDEVVTINKEEGYLLWRLLCHY